MMPGKARGKKRKAASAVAVLESTETSGESQDSPLTQGRFVPRFTKKARIGRPASIKSTAVPVCSEEAEKREERLEDGGRTLQHSQPSTAIDHEVPVVQLDVGNLESPSTLALTCNNTTTTTSTAAVCTYVPGLALSQTVPNNTPWATHTNDDSGGNHKEVTSCDPSSDVIPDSKDIDCKDDRQNFQLLDLMGDDKDNEDQALDLMGDDKDNEDQALDLMGDGKLSANKDHALIEESPVFTEELDLYHGEDNEATHLVSAQKTVMATEKAFLVPPPPSSPDAVLPNGEEADAVLLDSQDELETVSESFYGNVNDGKNSQTLKGGDKDLNLATSVEDTSVHSAVATHPASTQLECQAGTPLGTIGHQAGTSKGHQGGTSMGGDATPLHEAVREMMDLTAAELLESQFTDEAMVPSCSPASKTLARKAVDPLQHCLQEGIPGTSDNEGTRTLHGLIDELSALNRYILHCKKELDSARRQRNSWLKTRKGRRGGR